MNAFRLPAGAAALVLLLAGCSWIGFGDEPETGAVPPPDAANLAALDSTAGSDPVAAASEPALPESETALVPDAPPPEVVAAATTPAAGEPVDPGDPSLIEVRYSGARAPETVQLLAPDGTVIEPLEVERVTTETIADDGWPNIQAGVTGGSSSDMDFGVGIGFPLFGTEAADRPPQVRTLARFRLPDLPDYRENWQRYRVVMLFARGTPDEDRIEMLPPHPDATVP
jgi:hypothetical protein